MTWSSPKKYKIYENMTRNKSESSFKHYEEIYLFIMWFSIIKYIRNVCKLKFMMVFFFWIGIWSGNKKKLEQGNLLKLVSVVCILNFMSCSTRI